MGMAISNYYQIVFSIWFSMGNSILYYTKYLNAKHIPPKHHLSGYTATGEF